MQLHFIHSLIAHLQPQALKATINGNAQQCTFFEHNMHQSSNFFIFNSNTLICTQLQLFNLPTYFNSNSRSNLQQIKFNATSQPHIFIATMQHKFATNQIIINMQINTIANTININATNKPL